MSGKSYKMMKRCHVYCWTPKRPVHKPDARLHRTPKFLSIPIIMNRRISPQSLWRALLRTYEPDWNDSWATWNHLLSSPRTVWLAPEAFLSTLARANSVASVFWWPGGPQSRPRPKSTHDSWKVQVTFSSAPGDRFLALFWTSLSLALSVFSLPWHGPVASVACACLCVGGVWCTWSRAGVCGSVRGAGVEKRERERDWREKKASSERMESLVESRARCQMLLWPRGGPRKWSGFPDTSHRDGLSILGPSASPFLASSRSPRNKLSGWSLYNGHGEWQHSGDGANILWSDGGFFVVRGFGEIFSVDWLEWYMSDFW